LIDSSNNKEIGFIEVDLMECIKNPGYWKVDGIFVLSGNAKLKEFGIESFGEVYLQARFISYKIQS